MSIRRNGREGSIPQPFNNYLFFRRPDNTTVVNPSNKSCGHSRATARNVIAPGGAAAYLCAGCYRYQRAVETRAVEVDRARRELARLFRSWPLGSIPGAALASGLEVAR